MRDGLILLFRKGLRTLLHYRQLVLQQSMFRTVFAVTFMTGTMIGLWFIFYGGFKFLDVMGGVGLVIIQRLFSLFFLGLGMLLVLSSSITAYTTFFQSPEVPYLLLRPIRLKDIVTYKYVETAVMSSWAFFFIIFPFVAAYAMYQQLSPLFILWTFLFFLPFVLLCSAVGTLITLVLVRWLPRGRVLAVGIALFLGIVAVVVLKSIRVVLHEAQYDQVVLLQRLVPGFQLASHPLWPSYWLAEGIMSLTRDQWGRGLTFLALMVSYVGVGALLVRDLGNRLFFDGWQRVLHARSRTRRRRAMLRPLDYVLGWVLPPDFRGLVVKDLRVFLRDPAQWTQGLIFYGILGLYFVNLRNLHYHVLSAEWRNIIAFLNIFSVTAVMCSLGARFIYPQLSLEGQGFWMVGMSPVSMGRVLASKFVASAGSLLVVSLVLMLLSVEMLKLDFATRIAALSVAVAMSLTVAGMSTGLGAAYVDLKQRNPAVIISSFGGTLNLVLLLGFMFAAVLPFATVFHMHFHEGMPLPGLHRGLAVAYVWLFGLTAVSVGIPLSLGRRHLKNRDY